MGNNLGGAMFAGVIGGIIAVACWYVVNSVVTDPNIYVAVGLPRRQRRSKPSPQQQIVNW